MRRLTKQQRATLEVLLDEGPLTPFNLARLVPTSQNGLTRIVAHLYPLILFAYGPDVFYIPHEWREEAEDLLE